MIIITNAPRIMAIAVPATPEFGRNFFPGFTKLPQPMTQPKAIAHTCIGLRDRFKEPPPKLLLLIHFFLTHHKFYLLPLVL